MVKRYVIPFGKVTNRALCLNPSTIYEYYTDYTSVLNDVRKNKFNSLDKFFMENTSNNALADSNASNFINILSEDNVINNRKYNT